MTAESFGILGTTDSSSAIHVIYYKSRVELISQLIWVRCNFISTRFPYYDMFDAEAISGPHKSELDFLVPWFAEL